MTAILESPRFTNVEVAVESRDQLGETPLWCDRECKLRWLDVEKPKLQVFDPSTGAVDIHVRDCTFLGSQALTSSGALLLAEDLDCIIAPSADEPGACLSRVEEEIDNRLNDGRIDRFGRWWIGTMDNQLHRPNGALYRIDPDGRSDRIFADVIVSNGIAFSPDGRKMYFTDTRQHLSFVLGLDPEDGNVIDRAVLADYSATGDRPDGACVDVDGCLWTAFFGGGRLVRYTPDGVVDREVRLPVTNPTCLCFGGTDLKTLYVTTARKFLSEDQLAAEPLAGSLLALHGLGQGIAEHRFAH